MSKGELEALVAQTGIRNDSNVVVYDDVGGVSAARVWWVLSYYGFPSVRVLRCGWSGAVAMAAKLATGPAVWDETAVSDPGYFHASPQDDLLATADDALAASTVSAAFPARHLRLSATVDWSRVLLAATVTACFTLLRA